MNEDQKQKFSKESEAWKAWNSQESYTDDELEFGRLCGMAPTARAFYAGHQAAAKQQETQTVREEWVPVEVKSLDDLNGDRYKVGEVEFTFDGSRWNAGDGYSLTYFVEGRLTGLIEAGAQFYEWREVPAQVVEFEAYVKSFGAGLSELKGTTRTELTAFDDFQLVIVTVRAK